MADTARLAGGLALTGSLVGGPVLGAVAGVVRVALELLPFARPRRPSDPPD